MKLLADIQRWSKVESRRVIVVVNHCLLEDFLTVIKGFIKFYVCLGYLRCCSFGDKISIFKGNTFFSITFIALEN